MKSLLSLFFIGSFFAVCADDSYLYTVKSTDSENIYEELEEVIAEDFIEGITEACFLATNLFYSYIEKGLTSQEAYENSKNDIISQSNMSLDLQALSIEALVVIKERYEAEIAIIEENN